MDKQEIVVGMADMKISESPDILESLGIGSCVGIALYDKESKIGGLAHIMLPDMTVVKNKTNRAKFANTAIPDMLDKLIEKGAKREAITAKIMGGAHMFSSVRTNKVFNVGTRNVNKVKEVLRELGITIIAEDTGGRHGRSLYLDLETGRVRVKTLLHGERFL